MIWAFEKFLNSNSIVAICPKCGHFYEAGDACMQYSGLTQYRNCSKCGEFLFNPNTTIPVTWNQRDISVLENKEKRVS